MADAFDRSQVVVGEVEVRLARPDERRRWDALMDRYHYLGFRPFAGREPRHVALWCGWWLALQSTIAPRVMRASMIRWFRSIRGGADRSEPLPTGR